MLLWELQTSAQFTSALGCLYFELVCQADTHFIYICMFASLLPGSWSWDSCKSGRTAWPCTRLGTPEERQAGKIIAKIKKIDDKLPFFSFFLDCSSHHKLRKTCHIECCPRNRKVKDIWRYHMYSIEYWLYSNMVSQIMHSWQQDHVSAENISPQAILISCHNSIFFYTHQYFCPPKWPFFTDFLTNCS